MPDYQVFSDASTWHWVEVKGYYDAKSLTKIKRFRNYYPDETLVLVDSKWFSANSAKLKMIIPNWESGEKPTHIKKILGRKTKEEYV